LYTESDFEKGRKLLDENNNSNANINNERNSCDDINSNNHVFLPSPIPEIQRLSLSSMILYLKRFYIFICFSVNSFIYIYIYIYLLFIY
jgi:hypothetical protein